MSGLSLSKLESDSIELQKDLLVFKKAYDTVRLRLLETAEYAPARFQALEKWSGTWACIGSLEMAIRSIEQQIAEVERHIHQVLSGEIPNLDSATKRSLSVMDGGL